MSKQISIIIPAYNAERTISKTLERVFACMPPDGTQSEVIVVDDGSTDQTAEIVRGFGSVKYVYQENKGPAAARNRGLREGQGDIVFFTDSDCLPQSDWLEKMFPHFQGPQVGVVCGSYGIANPQSVLARGIHQEILFRHRTLMPQYPKVFGSYNFAVRKNVFEEAGGFNETYPHASGEDNDLAYKILNKGHKIYFEKESFVDHHHPERLPKYLKEQFRHGFWRVKMYADHPAMSKGDDYTFWKDMAEVPLSLLVLVGLAGSFFCAPAGYVFKISFLCLLCIELFYANRFLKNINEKMSYAFVMFLRSFARMFGFLSGVVNTVVLFCVKKNNDKK
ncbi:MAG: glycosyltransferase [Candidatus Omnitrophica bacterium]|nr:glycosyltransferase [Candidatus Omnitrophota bacterium]